MKPKFTNSTSNLNVKSQGKVSRDEFKCFVFLAVKSASRSEEILDRR
ncbi:hypothetical protein CAMRE0001_2011 [Campylobacter rectus RM3267]|uniref:Uncharacterized protein n=1 Tax=Campylobacter rectus RM3267 TaxID=553218 RepID=B9D3D3_CAMRE|nr:hypothetical protein CAMRE0001_2011 [Campylobacter rectus RM3267]